MKSDFDNLTKAYIKVLTEAAPAPVAATVGEQIQVLVAQLITSINKDTSGDNMSKQLQKAAVDLLQPISKNIQTFNKVEKALSRSKQVRAATAPAAPAAAAQPAPVATTPAPTA